MIHWRRMKAPGRQVRVLRRHRESVGSSCVREMKVRGSYWIGLRRKTFRWEIQRNGSVSVSYSSSWLFFLLDGRGMDSTWWAQVGDMVVRGKRSDGWFKQSIFSEVLDGWKEVDERYRYNRLRYRLQQGMLKFEMEGEEELKIRRQTSRT